MTPRRRSTSRSRRGRVVFWRDAALPMVEGRQGIDTHASYRPHTHPTLSIGIVDVGQSTFRNGGRIVKLQPGAVVITAPGEAHACNPLTGRPWSYRTFQFDAAWARACLGIAADAPWPDGVVRGRPAVRLVDRIERALRRTGDAEERSGEIRRCLRGLLRLCVRTNPVRPNSDQPSLLTIRDYLAAHCLERIPVATLARLAGFSAFRLIRLFKREFGLTPHAYQLDQRINRTRDLLRRGHALADVAYASGFSDQSHFQRAFKPRVAATPAQYRSGAGPTARRPR